MEKVCPRCKLPQEGINQCEYCGLVFKNYKEEIPVSQDVYKKIITLPLFPDISEEEIDYVVKAVIDFESSI